MAIRTALLNGNNISRDTDFSKYIETVSEAGVIEGLEVSATKVGIGKARVPCERTGGETIYALVYNSSEVTISGNGDVYIQVSQTYIDDGELANEDGTGIATIQVGTMPSKNALKLATISSGTVTDARNMIPKVGELNTQIESIFNSLEDLDERVEALEEAGAIDHLEESGLVGELYTLNDTLFKQNTPTLADSTLDCNVSDVAANSQIHIQRIASGVASNQLKLKVKMVGSSTQNLKVEVRKGVLVTVTEGVEAYWYGNQVVASGSIPYSEISTSYAEKTITLDNEFGGTKGELLDVVVYMDTVNATNYYCVACDSTQYSEGFSYVSVNGSTRARSKLMPYCISDGFAQSILSKVTSATITATDTDNTEVFSDNTEYICYPDGNNNSYKRGSLGNVDIDKNGVYNISMNVTSGGGGSGGSQRIYLDATLAVSSTNMTTGLKENSITISKGTYDVNYVLYTLGNNSSRLNSTIKGVTITRTSYILAKTGVNGIPKDLQTIGNNGFITIRGMVKGEFYKEELEKAIIYTDTSSEAITGAITLGNAVGFIVIHVGSRTFKIPYYG